MLKLKLVKGKTKYEAFSDVNGTVPANDYKRGTITVKELVEPWMVRGYIVVEADYHFSSLQY